MTGQNSAEAAPPGWYPDPTKRFEQRYWNGTAWTHHVTQMGKVISDSEIGVPSPIPVPRRKSPVLRRVLWSVYAWPITLLLVASGITTIVQHGALWIVDLGVTLPSLVAMQLHIWDHRVSRSAFWKAYAFVFIAWDLTLNVVLPPSLTGIPRLEPVPMLLVFSLLVPTYVATFRYAFRSWDAPGSS